MDWPNLNLHLVYPWEPCFLRTSLVRSNFFEYLWKIWLVSIQLDHSFSIVLTRSQEHGSHVVVVPELHLDELDAYNCVDPWMSILNIVWPPLSLWLNRRLIWFSLSFNLEIVTSFRTLNILGFIPL